jgi:hypothetical protein
MRSAAQISRTPAEWADLKARERQKHLKAVLADLQRAADQNQPWYRWIIDRQAGRHRHDLRGTKSEPVACPVPGCREHPEAPL